MEPAQEEQGVSMVLYGGQGASLGSQLRVWGLNSTSGLELLLTTLLTYFTLKYIIVPRIMYLQPYFGFTERTRAYVYVETQCWNRITEDLRLINMR